MNLGNIIAITTSAILIFLAIYFSKRKQYKRASIFAACWLVPGVLAISLGRGLNIEQWICWGFAVAFMYWSHTLLKDNHIGYAFVSFLVAAFVFFCGLTSVQSLLKTHLLWQVTSSLNSYGEKLDTFQSAIIDMRQGLERQQMTNDLNQMQLAEVQKTITNQFNRLTTVSNELLIAQNSLLQQKGKLEDIENLVEQIGMKSVVENISGSDTNRIFVIQDWGDVKQYGFLLNHSAVPNSIHGMIIRGAPSGSPSPLLAVRFSYQNFFYSNFGGLNVNNCELQFEYTLDTRQTNLLHGFKRFETNTVFFNEVALRILNN